LVALREDPSAPDILKGLSGGFWLEGLVKRLVDLRLEVLERLSDGFSWRWRWRLVNPTRLRRLGFWTVSPRLYCALEGQFGDFYLVVFIRFYLLSVGILRDSIWKSDVYNKDPESECDSHFGSGAMRHYCAILQDFL
jgi:hypothetical protein